MNTKSLLASACIICSLCLGGAKVIAQGPPGGGGFGGGNFDPADFQKMIMDNIREQLEVKDDGEWKVIGDQAQKVLDARMQIGLGGGQGMGRLFRRPGANGAQAPGNGQGGGRRTGGFAAAFGAQSNPEAEALQKAIDSNAPTADLKAAVAKFVEARKQKQARLEEAQDNLRKLLTVRQEAIAFSLGLL